MAINAAARDIAIPAMVAGWVSRDRRTIGAYAAAAATSAAGAASAPDPGEHGAVPAGRNQQRATQCASRAGQDVMTKPFKLAYPDPDEDQFQASVVHLFDAILRPEEAIYTHIAHGGYELSKAARARLFRLGLKPGWPDIEIRYSEGRSLFLEFKTATGKLSLGQRQRHAQLEALGHVVVVCRWSSRWAEDIIAILEKHGVPFRRAQVDGSYLYGTAIDQGAAQVGTASVA